MKTEIDNNGIRMDAIEQGSQTPPESAIAGLAEQLNIYHLETAATAVESIRKVALNSDDPQARVNAVGVLGEFASLYPQPLNDEKVPILRDLQERTREQIAAIAFGSAEMEVRLAAVQGLAKSLTIPATNEDRHQNTAQLIAIIGSVSNDNAVKNEAISALARYASLVDSGKDRLGPKYSYMETQNYANTAIAAVSKPVVASPSAPALP